MFDSRISAKEFINNLKSEIDVALPISDESYLAWLNSAEQFLYGFVIKEEGIYITEFADEISLPIDIEGENSIRSCDITSVYAKFSTMRRVQLLHVTLANGDTFKDVYFENGDKLCIKTSFPCNEAEIIYIKRPPLKKTLEDGNVMVPVEFVELIASKIRGEAYKLANEDSIAAKWLSDYNAHLQDFSAWCALKKAKVGM